MMAQFFRNNSNLTRLSHLTGSVVVAASLWLTACGSDVALTGGNLANAGDGQIGSADGISGGQDGSTIAPDGGTIIEQDGAVVSTDGQVGPSDTSTVPADLSCQGKCGQSKPNQWKCQCDAQCTKYGDCCGDYPALCTQTQPSITQLMACIDTTCPKEVAVCQSQKPCAAFWACAEQCNDQACIQGCTQGLDMATLSQQAGALQTCAQNSGCDGSTTKPTGPVCGDGKCEQPENSLNCLNDCPNTPPSDAQVCLSKACPSQYKTCFGDSACVAAVACINNGGAPQQCAGSDPKVGKELNSLLQCGQQNNCLGGATTAVCGNGQCEPGETAKNCPQDCSTSTGAVCGNGKCETGESTASCPKDCTVPTDPVTTCIASACPDLYQTCAGVPACISAAQCLLKGGSMTQCVSDMKTAQLVGQLVQCGNQSNCFGGTTPTTSCKGQCGTYIAGASCQCDAKCAQNGNCCGDYKTYCGTTTTPSCQGKCGSFDPNAACQCNVSCGSFGNCCSDYQQACGGSTGPVCGDGVCTAPETATSCAKDCSITPPAVACKTKADCAAAEICCGKADGSQVCSAPTSCF